MAGVGDLQTGRPATLLSLIEGDGGGTALVCPDESSLTYAELADGATRLAGRLSAIGVAGGDRVALVLPNGPEFVQLLFAVTALGATAAPLNPAYTRDEFAFYLGDIQPRALIVPMGDLQAARAAAEASTQIVEVVIRRAAVPDLEAGGRTLERASSFEDGRAEDVALLLHTSGTTSRPKQVPLLQRNLAAGARTVAEHYALSREDVSYCAMPLFHVHGLVASTLAALGAGGAVVVPRRLSPRRFWVHARDHGVTWLSAGPTLHHAILEKQGAEAPPPMLRFARSCSSALSPALMERAEQTYGVAMVEAYGMTEASHQMASNPLPPRRRMPGSVGIPTGTKIRVVDSAGRDVPEGAPGEIAIRGPGVTPGYLGNPDANAEAFFDGWFRTGDLGVFEHGYLRLEGRLKEMVLRGGENISPYEIEAVLLAHPAVSDAVCFGVPDERLGEELEAAVVLKAAAEERDLREHCRERVAAFKVPRAIRIVERIPRTPTGKLQRRRIAALLGEEGR